METFSWQFPDLDSLREFTKKKFKWTKLKADEILLPVMKKLEERKVSIIFPHVYAPHFMQKY